MGEVLREHSLLTFAWRVCLSWVIGAVEPQTVEVHPGDGQRQTTRDSAAQAESGWPDCHPLYRASIV